MLIRIDDPDDPRIGAYRDIRERDLVGRQNRFVAEGKLVVKILLSEHLYRAESLLILDRRLPGLRSVLDRLRDDFPVFVVSAATMNAIAGYNVHRGVLAIGMRSQPPTSQDLLSGLPLRSLVVGLIGVSNHDNVGAIFRNACAFGADAVLLDPSCCDPLYRKAIRVSVGACLKLPFARADNAAALVDQLHAHHFAVLALSPAGRTDIVAMESSNRMALLLGSEGTGLPQDLMDRAATVRIAMTEGFDSLNVAAASAIALHRIHEMRQLL